MYLYGYTWWTNAERDSYGFDASESGKSYYWNRPFTRFLAYTDSGNSLEKAEFIRQRGPETFEPYLLLLLNRPDISPAYTYNLPLTKDFGDVNGGMLARTGWNNQDDILVEIRGSDYRNGTHQHADAGSIQVYYRGFLIGDIGMYGFAGTDYDVNFNRCSVSHSMILVNDPSEGLGKSMEEELKMIRGKITMLLPQKWPKEAINNERFNNGTLISGNFDPSKQTPVFSYISVDLEGPYSNKVSE